MTPKIWPSQLLVVIMICVALVVLPLQVLRGEGRAGQRGRATLYRTVPGARGPPSRRCGERGVPCALPPGTWAECGQEGLAGCPKGWESGDERSQRPALPRHTRTKAHLRLMWEAGESLAQCLPVLRPRGGHLVCAPRGERAPNCSHRPVHQGVLC